MDQQPKIPTLKDAQKPQVKIKGLSAGLTLFDRLKQFKKKDLAFILAGLGTLFMAPLAEHFMMAPESGDGQLQQGWGKGGGGGSNLFGSGSSPYESGSNGGIAQGGAIGGMGDIITPLNVRDPSALVMGPGAAQQPNAGSAAPATPPPSAPQKSESDYKDALAGAASRAASAAVKKSPLPVPKVALGGSGLRGLGVAGGGTSASGSMLPVGPAAGSNSTGGGSSMNLVRATPGYKGAAGARGPGNPTGLDGTKRAGANAGDAFSRTGNALQNLNTAASEQIPTGGSGFSGSGQGGAGANDKSPGGSGPGGSKSVGESLAFIEAKERMENRLKNEFEMEKLKDNERLLYEIRNESIKEIAKGLTGAFTKSITGALFPAGGGAAMLDCGGAPVAVSAAEGQLCTGSKDGAAATDRGCFKKTGGGVYVLVDNTGKETACTGGKGSGTPTPRAEEGLYKFGRVNDQQSAAMADLGTVCTMLDDIIAANSKVEGGGSTNADKLSDAGRAKNIRAEAAGLVSVRDALYRANSSDCSGTGRRSFSVDPSISVKQRSAIEGKITPLINKMKRDAAGTAPVDYKADLDAANADVNAAGDALKTVRDDVKDDLSNIAKADQGWTQATIGIEGNKEKIDRITKSVTGARDGLVTALADAVSVQNILDGKKDGKLEEPAGKVQVMPSLGTIAAGDPADADAGGTPMKITIDSNKAKGDFQTGNQAKFTNYGSAPAGGAAAGDASPDGKGVAYGKGGKSDGQTKQLTDAQPLVDKADTDATAAKRLRETAKTTTDNTATEDIDEKQVAEDAAKAAEDTAKTSKEAADKAVDSVNKTSANVQSSQTTWLDAVARKAESAKSSIPPSR